MGIEKDESQTPREMHKIICSECGQETEVPFKPDGVRPVYCKECYRKKKPARQRSNYGGGSRRPYQQR